MNPRSADLLRFRISGASAQCEELRAWGFDSFRQFAEDVRVLPYDFQAGIQMNRSLVALAIVAASMPCLAQDAAETDGDKYRVLLDNPCVRVFKYRDEPGQKTHQHHHSAFVLYALGPFERVIHLPDGKAIKRNFKAGDIIWSPAQTHIGENVGSTPTDAVIVESKPSGKDLSECS